MAEIVEFRVPLGTGRTLLVSGLESDKSEHALHLTFSAFGLLYAVRLYRNAPESGPGYHAFVKFYSARDASRAQWACDGKLLFQKTAVKVCICTRQRALAKRMLPLSSYKSRELANYYLGFNGWSSRIITKMGSWQCSTSILRKTPLSVYQKRNSGHIQVTELSFSQLDPLGEEEIL